VVCEFLPEVEADRVLCFACGTCLFGRLVGDGLRSRLASSGIAIGSGTAMRGSGRPFVDAMEAIVV
jgi:hypothetical protein